MSSLPCDTPNAHEEVVEDDEFWVDDGNLIVSVRSDNGVRLFKIHKSTLSRQSPVFETMFTLPQGSAPESEVYMGLPTMHLTDNHDDVKKLLNLVYTPLALADSPRFSQSTQEQLLGPLRLATKYEMENLRERIIEALVRDWPTTLREWDLYQETIKFEFSEQPEDYEVIITNDFPCWTPDPIEIIHIAQECNVPKLLPAAFYHLNRSYHAPDMSQECGPALTRPRQALKTNLLTPQDFHRLMIGRQKLADHIRSRGLLFTIRQRQERHHRRSEEPSDVEAHLKCVQAMNRYTNNHHFVQAAYTKGEDPLTELYEAAQSIPSVKDGLCYPCRDFVREEIEDLRQSVWDSLGEYFSGD